MDSYLGLFITFAIVTLVITAIICAFLESNKFEKKKGELVKNNKFISENREKYEKIMEEKAASLAPERKIDNRRSTIVITLLVISIVLNLIFQNPFLMMLIPVSVILPSLIWSKQANLFAAKGEKMYNETVAAILKEYDNNLNYYPDKGYNRNEYESLYFFEECDVYKSNDMIVNDQTGFCYADVHIESISHDDDGPDYHVEFDGSLTRMDINNVGCTIILGGLGAKSFKKIKFENEEFNKMFTCFSDNELVAYKVLTPDVMEEFVSIGNDALANIQVRIINDKLYIRFSCTNSFDGDENSKEELFQSVAILDKIIKTMNKVKQLIDDKNLN